MHCIPRLYTIAKGSEKNKIFLGGHEALKLQLVQKKAINTRVVMPSRDRPKHSAYAVGPKSRLRPDSVAVSIPGIESLLRICILLSPRSAWPITAWTRVCNVAVTDRIINGCKCIPRRKLQSLNHNKSTADELAKMIALKIPLDHTCKSRELVYDSSQTLMPNNIPVPLIKVLEHPWVGV